MYQIGVSFLKSIKQYSQLEVQLEGETWLKPSMLRTFGGESARYKLEKEIRESRIRRRSLGNGANNNKIISKLEKPFE